jgi:hypothetical protein
LKAALVKVPERLSWEETSETQAVAGEDDKAGARVTAH